MKNIAANIGAIIFGLIGYIIATYVLALIFGLLLRIPLIGTILYWPADGKLVAGVTVNTFSVGGAWLVIRFFNRFIDGERWGQKVVATVLVIGYIISIVSLFTNAMFSFTQLISFVAGIGAAVLLWNNND